ncbi:MAG: hypothetical protein HRU81_13035 [Gammaproteobacteria bacterium]|nr:MAG: hypothetical protein HRU81_13035 [Gammaproteobacteria bacterium]
MRRADIDLGFLVDGLRWRLVAFAAALLLFGVAWWVRTGISVASERQRGELAALEQQRVEFAERLDARQAFEPRFQSLVESGVVGEAQRLLIAQGLRDAATALGIPYLRYAMGPRHAFQAPYLGTGTAAPVMATAVDVQAGFAREADLLRLLAWLRQEVPGYFDVAACSLERVGGDAAPQAGKASFAGSCTLRWYSIPLDAPGTQLAGHAAPELQRARRGRHEAGAGDDNRPAIPVPGRRVVVNGVLRPRHGPALAWLNGQPQPLEMPLDAQNRVAVPAAGAAAPLRLKPGQSWDPVSRRVHDCGSCIASLPDPGQAAP